MPMIRTANPPRKSPDSADLTEVPAVIRKRLRAEGINTADDWRTLGERRRMLWGITKATVALIDRAWGQS